MSFDFSVYPNLESGHFFETVPEMLNLMSPKSKRKAKKDENDNSLLDETQLSLKDQVNENENFNLVFFKTKRTSTKTSSRNTLRSIENVQLLLAFLVSRCNLFKMFLLMFLHQLLKQGFPNNFIDELVAAAVRCNYGQMPNVIILSIFSHYFIDF
jgi:hypothetical protein